MEKWKDGKTAKIEMCLCAKKKKKDQFKCQVAYDKIIS